MTDGTHSTHMTSPEIRRVHTDRPWAWLAAGWRDLRRAPMLSLPFGLVYAAVGLVGTILIWSYGDFHLIIPLASGFVLIGPIVAVGLYQISRRLSRGESVRWSDVATAWRSNPMQIALMGLVLLLFMMAWFRFASLLMFIFLSDQGPSPDALVLLDLMTEPENLPYLFVGTVIGAAMSALAFMLSVVSIPLLMDRPESDVISAIVTSVKVVRENFWTMALWAWLVALFIFAGVVTAYVLLVITLPLVGHATWHAYADLVGWNDEDSREG